MTNAKCQRCGHLNDAGARFCSSCGAALVGTESTASMSLDAVAAALEELEIHTDEFPHGTGLLVVTRGPKAGSRYALDADVVTAGRHPRSDIFLDDVTVSRRHAELVRRDERFYVRDVGSLNGTYVNRHRIDECELEDGDELQIGMFKLVFAHGTKR